MFAYLAGNEALAVTLAVAAAFAIGVGASWLFTWASNRSALWNIGLGITLVRP